MIYESMLQNIKVIVMISLCCLCKAALSHNEHFSRMRRAEGDKVCYNHLGCFTDNGDRPLPLTLKEMDTKFYLWTPEQNKTLVTPDNLGTFSEGRKTKLVIHGFRSSTDVWVTQIANILTTKYKNFNVLAVDWRNGANVGTLNYMLAVANLRLVAAQTAYFLEQCVKKGALTPARVHCLGHSLGAHTCGFVSQRLSQRLGRITAFDPAGPSFFNAPIAERLSPDDAGFVDAIHTDAGFKPPFFGMKKSVGHVDLYPNGGKSQPGCFNRRRKRGDGLGLSCSHNRGFYYYMESLETNCHFMAFPCRSIEEIEKEECSKPSDPRRYQIIGLDSSNLPARGIFYLTTNKAEPFCQGGL